jgi:hypothetical protein
MEETELIPTHSYKNPKKRKQKCLILIVFVVVGLLLLSNFVMLVLLLQKSANLPTPPTTQPLKVLCSSSCERVCQNKEASCFNQCYDACSNGAPSNNNIASSIRRDAIHHVHPYTDN